ncbi:hypothetical protein PC9H_009285 [Pleurotus ostreatus]|uniref:C2H2-type domain-containing protein n=1 Tax=Pleurotus ostreatus TaxID=5322 RepID=A0A8H7DP52_PLEOS|nr:uncharacterized protein PC9H_009285 [Pleurotus ostreatus]KAF7423985.1 hypothetical protein PC9H_009285 [Pleurotus ostreatus]KAJ8693209.1 hypothetical protein PTI98_010448 [Pleurotus ostreatus]
MSHHAPSQNETINIHIESFDEGASLHVEGDSQPFSGPVDFLAPQGSDDEGLWTPGNSAPTSPAALPQSFFNTKEYRNLMSNAHSGNVHIRSDSSSSLNANLLSGRLGPQPIDTTFASYRSTATDPIFSPEDNFAGHEFPEADDSDTLLFGANGFISGTGDSTQETSPVDTQLDLSSFALHTAPVHTDSMADFLQVPFRPGRPRSNTHEGTVPTVAPRDVFPATSVSSVLSEAEISALQLSYSQTADAYDSAISDDTPQSAMEPVMRSSSSTLFGALGPDQHWIDPITKVDPRRRKSDTGVSVKPSMVQLLASHRKSSRSQSNISPIYLAQQSLTSPQQLASYQSGLSVPVIPAEPSPRQRSGSVTSSPRGRGIIRSTPGSRRHSPYPQPSKLPSPSSEYNNPYVDLNSASYTLLDTNGYPVKSEESSQDQVLAINAFPGLSRNRTVPAGSPNHVPLAENPLLKRSISVSSSRSKYDIPAQYSNSTHLPLVEERLASVAVKSEPGMTPMAPFSTSPARPTVTSDATRAAADKRRVKEYKFFCPQCPQGFTARHNYERHVHAHEGRRPYLCSCGTPFTSKSDRKRHIDRSKNKPDCQGPPIDLDQQ